MCVVSVLPVCWLTYITHWKHWLMCCIVISSEPLPHDQCGKIGLPCIGKAGQRSDGHQASLSPENSPQFFKGC